MKTTRNPLPEDSSRQNVSNLLSDWQSNTGQKSLLVGTALPLEAHQQLFERTDQVLRFEVLSKFLGWTKPNPSTRHLEFTLGKRVNLFRFFP